jgi:phosphoglycerate kinase
MFNIRIYKGKLEIMGGILLLTFLATFFVLDAVARTVRQGTSETYVPGMFKSVDDLLKTVKSGDRIFIRGDVDTIRKGKLKDESGRIDALAWTLAELFIKAKELGKDIFVIIAGHNGRPKREDIAADMKKFSLEALVGILTEKLRRLGTLSEDEQVEWAGGYIGEEVSERLDQIAQKEGPKIALLEDLRFDPRENTDDAVARLDFARELLATTKANHFINEAFASSARMNASTLEMAQLIKEAGGLCVAGIQLIKELDSFTEVLIGAKGPKTAIFGGKKLDKLETIVTWLEKGVLGKGDTLHIGGLLGVYILKVRDENIGSTEIDPEYERFAQRIVDLTREKRVRLLTYKDATIQNVRDPDDVKYDVPIGNIPDGYIIVDIGTKTIEALGPFIYNAGVRFWNGAQGKYEDPRFIRGTGMVLNIIGDADRIHPGGLNIAAGGDAVTTLMKFLLSDPHKVFRLISTGGGAGLEFVANRWLIALGYLDRTPFNSTP